VNIEGCQNGRSKYLAVIFPSVVRPNGTLCVPTAIGVSANRFVFGEEAESLPETRVIRSVKMAIPCIGTAWGDYEAPFMDTSKAGYFTIGPHSLSATDLAMLYLANIIRQVKEEMRKYLPSGVHVQVFLNLAAPLNQLVRVSGDRTRVAATGEVGIRDTIVSAHYVALGQRCLRVTDGSSNPWDVRNAVEVIRKAKAERQLPLDDSPAYVVPEALAAITSYVNQPGAYSGRFMTLDVGAGSTDGSVFWLEKHNGTTKPWYYAAASLHTGMDAIDRSLRGITQAYAGMSMRQRREDLQRKNGGLMLYREHCRRVLAQIYEHQRTTFGHGYLKEPQQRKWGDRDQAKVTLLLIGGGAQSDVIQDLAGKPLWEHVIGSPTVEILDPDVAHALLPSGEECSVSKLRGLADQIPLLIIADGLARRIVDIPPYGACSEPLATPRPPMPDDHVYDQWW